MKAIKNIKSKTQKTNTSKAKGSTATVPVPAIMPESKIVIAPLPAPEAAPKTKTVKTSEPKAKPANASLSAPEITTEQIARCAYSIWEEEGRPSGKQIKHWLQAEKQLKAALSFPE